MNTSQLVGCIPSPAATLRYARHALPVITSPCPSYSTSRCTFSAVYSPLLIGLPSTLPALPAARITCSSRPACLLCLCAVSPPCSLHSTLSHKDNTLTLSVLTSPSSELTSIHRCLTYRCKPAKHERSLPPSKSSSSPYPGVAHCRKPLVRLCPTALSSLDPSTLTSGLSPVRLSLQHTLSHPHILHRSHPALCCHPARYSTPRRLLM